MSQPTLRFANFQPFLPLNPNHENYTFIESFINKTMGLEFYKIKLETTTQKSEIYLINEVPNTLEKYQIQLEAGKERTDCGIITMKNVPTIDFYKKQIVLSINSNRLSALGILVSIIFAGFKFFRGIKRVNWIFPISSLAISSIGFIYSTTLQRKAMFGFLNLLATMVDSRKTTPANLIVINYGHLIVNKSQYKKHPFLPWSI